MTRPRLLDLFSGEGGAAVGYHRAGFDVVGVDIKPQPNYPFEFHQGDAMTWPLDGFDAIHASPPCQAFTQMSARWRGKGGRTDEHVDLLTPTRARFSGLTVPWVIENVPGAIHHMSPTVSLHGGMFGLGVHRPRLFESNVLLMAAWSPRTRSPIGVYGKPDGRTTYRYRNNGNYKGKSLIRAWKSLEEGAAAMGIDWMDVAGLREAIPPAYTEHIGHQLLAHLGEDRHPARADQQPDDDQHDAERPSASHDVDDAGHHQDHGEQPQQKQHGYSLYPATPAGNPP